MCELRAPSPRREPDAACPGETVDGSGLDGAVGVLRVATVWLPSGQVDKRWPPARHVVGGAGRAGDQTDERGRAAGGAVEGPSAWARPAGAIVGVVKKQGVPAPY